jgi:hypothetical protein
MLEINYIIKKTWEWIKFIAWLPYLFVTLPWQLRIAYSQFMYAVSFNEYRERPGSESKTEIGLTFKGTTEINLTKLDGQ